MTYIVTILVGFAFGALDQYLGSRSALGAWASAVSLMSAPWILLPFAVGWTQVRSRRAMTLGLIVTMSALAGYFVMTYSPLEGVPIARFWSGEVAVVTSGYNPIYIVVGAVTGPLFAFLGYRWRLDRWWVSALAVVTALCLEPVARRTTGQLLTPGLVWAAEAATGLVAAALFVLARRSARQIADR
jgi:hypothetical protein